jgi:CheY-like chemotaxis protein
MSMDEELLDGKTLLVVDDEPDLREIVASELEFMGAKVFQAENVAAAKKVLSEQKIDLIVSDIRMPGGTGIDLLEFVKSKNVDIPPVILITGFADITVSDAFNKGAEALMNKPFKLDDLVKTVARFTKNGDERFQDSDLVGSKSLEINMGKSYQECVDANECSIGRGGITVRWNTGGKRIEQGEPLDLRLIFSDLELKGIVICRWAKQLDQSHYAEIGLEFVNISGNSLIFFMNQWKDKNIVPFISTTDSVS